MPRDFDFLVFIGRFQPYHNGHHAVVTEALRRASFVIVLVGSARRPRCGRNPWTFAEREMMIRACLSEADNRRVLVLPVTDAAYNDDLWISAVQKTVAGAVAAHPSRPDRAPRVALIGHSKDHSGYYLRLFPQWGSVDVPSAGSMSASELRAAMFASGGGASFEATAGSQVPTPVLRQLSSFMRTPEFERLRAELDFVRSYRARWAGAPYPPMFVTVDAVVVQSGHVLLVERNAPPGKGLWALPGGFVEPDETLRAAVLRELDEETGIEVPEPVLEGSIERAAVFDDPYRSARGRTITHAFLIRLPANSTLPKVKGNDDAADAFWAPLAGLDPERMFEDHYFIIQRMVGRPV